MSDLDRVRTAAADLGYLVRRAWPRSADHLLLDLVRLDGEPAVVAGGESAAVRGARSVAGQWFADPAAAARTATRTPGSVLADGDRAAGRLLLQPGGADAKLAGLAGLLATPGHTLIGHRPERRAVVRRLPGGSGDATHQEVFLKVVPRRRLDALYASARRAEQLPLRTPVVAGVDSAYGAVLLHPVPGRPLTALLEGPDGARACEAVGRTLAGIHALEADGLATHGAAEEAEVVRRWLGWAEDWGAGARAGESAEGNPDERHEVERADQALGGRAAAGAGAAALLPPEPPAPARPALIHRDFHDGQVLIDDAGTVGVIDFDLMAAGDPALDVANLIAHLDLREQQGGPAAGPLTDALLEGYRPDPVVLAALPYYLATSRLRLAAVYAFRDASLPS